MEKEGGIESYFVHKLSDVQSKKIGDGTRIWQFTVVLESATIGANCNINCNCFIENDVIIGDNVTVKSGVQIWDGITLEKDVFIGPNVTFTNDYVPRSKVYSNELKRTYVREGASIGANSTLIGGITIGQYALVGAGSVVTKDVPANALWYGNPGRLRGYVTNDGVLLDLSLTDTKNNVQYTLKNGELFKK